MKTAGVAVWEKARRRRRRRRRRRGFVSFH